MRFNVKVKDLKQQDMKIVYPHQSIIIYLDPVDKMAANNEMIKIKVYYHDYDITDVIIGRFNHRHLSYIYRIKYDGVITIIVENMNDEEVSNEATLHCQGY